MVAVRTVREEERMPTAGENQLNTMFLIPIRYWEDGPLREVEPLELSEMHVYGKEAAEEQPMYYSRDMCFYSRQKAQEARELLTKLLEVRRRDAIEYLVARLTATL